jgi:hypothetical protein
MLQARKREQMDFRERGVVCVYGRILEQFGRWFEGDFQGAHGFSGTGMMDPSGRLTNLISATLSFHHLSGECGENESTMEVIRETMESSLAFDWKQARKDCRRDWNHNCN